MQAYCGSFGAEGEHTVAIFFDLKKRYTIQPGSMVSMLCTVHQCGLRNRLLQFPAKSDVRRQWADFEVDALRRFQVDGSCLIATD